MVQVPTLEDTLSSQSTSPTTPPPQSTAPPSPTGLPTRLESVDFAALARDVVLFLDPGVFTREHILGEGGYNLTDDDMELIADHPPYKVARREWQRKTTANAKALVREQAKLLYSANLGNLHIRMQSPDATLAQITNAMHLLADLADLTPKKEDNTSGLTVVLDFGSQMNNVITTHHNPRNVIDHEPNQ